MSEPEKNEAPPMQGLDMANIDEMEYRVPARLFAQLVSLAGELPGRVSWQVMAQASQLRPTKKE